MHSTRDAERVDRLVQTIGSDLFTDLVHAVTVIGADTDAQPRESTFMQVAQAAREAGLPPEDLLVAARAVSRSVFKASTPEAKRVDDEWLKAVRSMMAEYFAPHNATPS